MQRGDYLSGTPGRHFIFVVFDALVVARSGGVHLFSTLQSEKQMNSPLF